MIYIILRIAKSQVTEHFCAGIYREVISMDTAKVFMSGRSQAVRLPKEYRFDDDEVYINKVGNVVMLYPKNDEWANFFNGASLFTDDYMSEPLEDPTPEEIESL